MNNLVTTHAGQTYERDYVIDYTSPENDDLYVYAMGNGQLEYEQRHVYAGSERIEQITERGTGSWERTLYVHEDVMGNTRYYTKTTGQSFAELQYDAWGQPVSPNKLVNNDHGNYVFATFTGHIYDTTLDIYFAEARFYDATNRTWLAMDPIKDGLNWYQYCLSNPTTNWDPTGLAPGYFNIYNGCSMQPIVIDWGSEYILSNVYQYQENYNLIFFTIAVGNRNTFTLLRQGDTSNPLTIYFNQRSDNQLLSSAGIKASVGNLSANFSVGLDNIGVTASNTNDDVTSYFSAKVDLTKLTIGIEWGITGPEIGGVTETSYYNVGVTPQNVLAILAAAFGGAGVVAANG